MPDALSIHKLLESAGIPITGVGITGTDAVVHFSPEATPEQQDQANQIIAEIDWNAPTARETFDTAVAAGYLVEPEGFTIALTERDRSDFAQLMVLTKEALELGLAQQTDTTTIDDINGGIHTVTLQRLREILVGYGFYYKGLWNLLSGG